MTEIDGFGIDGFDRTVERLKAALAARDAELAEVMKWKEAVINELIVAHIYSQAHDDSPRKAIQDAITWNCQVALDPAVSSDAQRLRDTHLQRAEAAERKAEEAARDAARLDAIADYRVIVEPIGEPNRPLFTVQSSLTALRECIDEIAAKGEA